MKIISEYIDAMPDLNAQEKARLNYFLSCVIYEGSKIILFLLFFSLTHHLKSFLYALMILLPLRTISGGLHFKHYISCFAFSFGYFYTVTVLLQSVQLPFWVSILLLISCVFINYAIGPVTSDSRPPLTTERIKQGRLRITAITCYESILTGLFFDTSLATVGFWTIVLHSVQLIIAKLCKKRGENHV